MESTLQIDARVVREFGPGLVSFAQRSLNSRADAEDLVQEMWIGALGSAQRFEGRASVRTWLTSILRRRMAEHFRRRRPQAELDEESLLSDDATVERLATHEHALQLRARLHELSQLEARALTLCTIDELDRDHVCSELGITRGHLRVLLHRARTKLVESETHDAWSAASGQQREAE